MLGTNTHLPQLADEITSFTRKTRDVGAAMERGE